MATVETTRLRIGPADHGMKMTLREFEGAEEEEGFRYELARGVLEVTNVPNDPHRRVVSNVYEGVADYRRRHPGVVLCLGGGSEFQILTPGMVSGRNPDLGVVTRGTRKDDRGRRQPTLVAEVVSEGGEERDYVAKREEYLAFGIQEYWVVDIKLRRLTFLWRRGDTWGERAVEGAEAIPSLVLPGLASTAADLWVDLGGDEDEAAERA